MPTYWAEHPVAYAGGSEEDEAGDLECALNINQIYSSNAQLQNANNYYYYM